MSLGRPQAGAASTGTRIRRPADERRRQLLDVGREYVGRVGPDMLTVRRLAEEANVSLGIVHYCFASKEVFVGELYKDIVAFPEGDEDRTPSVDLADALRRLAEDCAVAWDHDRHLTRLMRGKAALEPSWATAVVERDQARFDHIAGVLATHGADATLAAGQDLDATARALHALTSFESYDDLAGDEPLASVVPLVSEVALRIAGVDARS